jgi:hypothetical protein
MMPFIQVAQMGDPGQDAQQEGQYFGLRCMHDAFLRHGHLREFLDEADLVGKLGPGEQEGMFGELGLRFAYPGSS